ncbi:MAG: efflux RND transporter periplasmic adaptor subunit [Phycisphaeraceae bacterium]|nr:efflux RND transporter periplasmic adaptor subunit [Phycisphaeraceae bacterium]
MTSPPGLAALSRQPSARQSAAPNVPRPAYRWRTRVLLPALVLLSAAAVLAWSARDALWPAIEVRVVPVVAMPRGMEQGGESGHDGPEGRAPRTLMERTLVQAPGWIEPAPYAIAVPALTDGVVKEVLVLEGQRIEAGAVVARLIDDDARLALRRAQAELAERAAAIARARADEAAMAARAAAVRDELERKRPLAADGSVSGAELSRLTLQLRAAEADIASASAAVAAADAAHHTQQVVLEQAALAMARTEIRSPVAGVVLSRSIEPGTRLTMTSPGPGEAHESGVVRLYDPASLQVRVDVPLADAAKVQVGARAQVVSESLPDRTFAGTVTRIVHEANIQRNTVQFKVLIESPDAVLKPEMLVRVRIMASGRSADSTAPGDAAPDAGFVLVLPVSAVQDVSGDSAAAWFVGRDARGRAIASRRMLKLGARHATGAEYIEIESGAGPTDRAIVDPPAALAEGSRIRIIGEAKAATEESP